MAVRKDPFTRYWRNLYSNYHLSLLQAVYWKEPLDAFLAEHFEYIPNDCNEATLVHTTINKWIEYQKLMTGNR